MYSQRSYQYGFSLVELLVVMVIFGIFSGAVYSLYITHLKTAYSRDEVIDVQQNVRIAMDRLTRDIRMAGLFITPAIDKTMSNYSTISFQTTPVDMTRVTISRLLSEQNENFAVTPSGNFSMSVGDKIVILRPTTKVQIAKNIQFKIFSLRSSATVNPRLIIEPIPTYPDVPVLGDMLFKLYTTSERAPGFPQRIRYGINRTDTSNGCDKSPCLVRSYYTKTGVWNDEDIIAQGISNIRFDYFRAGTNTLATDQAADANSLNTLSNDTINTISAIRVSVTGQTAVKPGSNSTVKTRELKSLVKLRNYR